MKNLIAKLLSKLFPPPKLLTPKQLAIVAGTIRVNR